MNPQQLGNSYMDIVNRVLGGLHQSTPGYQMNQAIEQNKVQGIDPLSMQGLRNPQMNDAMLNMVMAGSVNTPEKMTPGMVEKILKNTGKYRPRVKDVWGDEEGKQILERAMRVLTGNYQ